MTNATSVCRIYNCSECDLHSEENCPGCERGSSALLDAGKPGCEVFRCVRSKGIDSCDDCPEASCELRRRVETICPLRAVYQKPRWWAGRMARALEKRGCREAKPISDKVVERVRWYLTALDQISAEGPESISSWRLAERVGVSAALIRKDLARFGEMGIPSHGYDVSFLRARIREILKLDAGHGVIWVGANCLRLHYRSLQRLSTHNVRLLAVFDVNDDEVGWRIGEHEVLALHRMGEVCANSDAGIAVLALAGSEAQEAVHALVDGGVRAILNLSGEMLVVPDRIRVSNLDIAGELLQLCYYAATP